MTHCRGGKKDRVRARNKPKVVAFNNRENRLSYYIHCTKFNIQGKQKLPNSLPGAARSDIDMKQTTAIMLQATNTGLLFQE